MTPVHITALLYAALSTGFWCAGALNAEPSRKADEAIRFVTLMLGLLGLVTTLYLFGVLL